MTLLVDENGINKKSKSGHCGGYSAPIKEKGFKIPKKMGEAADLLYTLRAQRLEIEKQAEELKKQESRLKQHFIDRLGKEQAAEGVVGSLATVRVLAEVIPVVTDWRALTEYIERHDDIAEIGRLVDEIRGVAFPAKALKEVVRLTGLINDIVLCLQAHSAVDLLQRRLSNEAVKARWGEGKPVPGVDKMNVDKVSVTKR